MAIDFKAKLAAERRVKAEADLQAKLAREIKKPKANLNDFSEPKEKAVEEVIPTINELGLTFSERVQIKALTSEYFDLAQQAGQIKKAKDFVSSKIKAICNSYGFDKALVGEMKVTLYETTNSSVDANSLLAFGVQPSTIKACTKTTTSKALRVSRRKGDFEEED